MHGSFEKSRETGKRIYRGWGIGILALPALIAIALIGVAITHRGASNWISQAVQAEFVGTDQAPDVTPTQLAQPATRTRTVGTN